MTPILVAKMDRWERWRKPKIDGVKGRRSSSYRRPVGGEGYQWHTRYRLAIMKGTAGLGIRGLRIIGEATSGREGIPPMP